MKINNKLPWILSLLLLLIFSFSFLHSELDQFKAKDDDHTGHEYSHLVKETITRSPQANTVHLEISKIDKLICSNPIRISAPLIYSVELQRSKLISHRFKDKDTFILFNSFLL
jgi:hypothetical protein